MSATEISPELVERIRVLLTKLHDTAARCTSQDALWPELSEVIPLLPKPVDPDLIEVRQIIAEHYKWLQPSAPHLVEQVMSGFGDGWFQTKCALQAIKRGRELAASVPA